VVDRRMEYGLGDEEWLAKICVGHSWMDSQGYMIKIVL